MMQIELTRRTAFGMLAAAALLTNTPSAVGAYEPYLGEIMLVPYNFCPLYWVEADGRLLSISQHTALYSLMGTAYGGDGVTNFALPDLRGRVAVGVGTGSGLTPVELGEMDGQETTTLNLSQLPSHNHTATTQVTLHASNASADSDDPSGRVLAEGDSIGSKERIETDMYSSGPANVEMQAGAVSASTTIGNTGGSQPFSVLDPYLGLRYCIAIQGIYPSRP